jgi:phospholipid-binding lipoprotein MlaA
MRAALAVAPALLAVCGCASQNFSMRTVPAETPAADNAAAIMHANDLAAAAKVASARSANLEVSAALVPLTEADAPSMYSYDPWERLNRSIYRFNARFDEAIFLPVADDYRRLPAPIRLGTHNFFSNLAEPRNIVNYALQLRPVLLLRHVGRFVINSTVGIGGLLDVAARMNLTSAPTGLSATLSTWGMHPGPYLVIPVLGPATLRDGIGLLGDYAVGYAINLADLYRGDQAYILGTIGAIDLRASIDFRYYASGSPFEYETIRFLYVHRELIEDEVLRRTAPAKVRPDTPAGQ